MLFLACTLLLSSATWALDLVTDVKVLSGYDSNINRKEERRKTESAFVSVLPAVSLYGEIKDGVTTGGGYRLTYTEYLSEGLENMMLHKGWGEVTARIFPGLFLNAACRLEILENRESPDDDGWGGAFSPGLTYHVSDTLSARIVGSYEQWKYDNLNFDSGRAIIRLHDPQVDNTFAGEGGITWLLFLGTSLDLAYRFTYNESNNSIDEYTIHNLLVGVRSAVADNLNIALGYGYERWNYFNWRAGKMLRGRLRDDDRHCFRMGIEYSASSFLNLFFTTEVTVNDSTLDYESFDRYLVYGGIRFSWDQWGW